MRIRSFLGVIAGVAMVSGAACAQNAVQWRVEEGGNGHWYAAVAINGVTWSDAQDAAVRVGGELSSIQSATENAFVFSNCASYDPAWMDGIQTSFGPWIGGIDRDGTWSWSDDSDWTYANWADYQPSGKPDGAGRVHFHNMWTEQPASTWNDLPDQVELNGYIVEWSADCDNDGIVDYGQILDGTVVDDDENGIPDICEGQNTDDYETVVLGSEPIAYWRMDTPDGFVENMIEGSPDLTPIGLPTSDQTAVGCDEDMSLRFNGNSYLSAGDDPRFEMDLMGDFSVEAWIKIPAQSDEMIISRSRDIVQGNWDIRTVFNSSIPDGIIEFRLTYIGGASAAWNPSWSNNWIHIVGVADEATNEAVIYINGERSDSNELTAPIAGTANYPLLIGRHNVRGAYAWNTIGSIDEVAIYDRALSPDEIAAHYAAADPDKLCTPACIGNFTQDEIVDAADLGILLAVWGDAAAYPQADLNGDGTVNAADLGILLSGWGPCPE